MYGFGRRNKIQSLAGSSRTVIGLIGLCMDLITKLKVCASPLLEHFQGLRRALVIYSHMTVGFGKVCKSFIFVFLYFPYYRKFQPHETQVHC